MVPGRIRIEYDGRMPGALCEQLDSMRSVRVARLRPLTLLDRKPEESLNKILRYLGDRSMLVRRVEVRSAKAS